LPAAPGPGPAAQYVRGRDAHCLERGQRGERASNAALKLNANTVAVTLTVSASTARAYADHRPSRRFS
jgi:hypothetical protein